MKEQQEHGELTQHLEAGHISASAALCALARCRKSRNAIIQG